MVIVCDDTRTAPAYFTELQRAEKQRVAINVCPAECTGASPQAMLEQAQRKLKTLANNSDDEDRLEVWLLLDLEGTSERRSQAEEASAQAKRNAGGGQGIKVARSDPCFEVWTLLHLKDTGKHFADCRQVLARVRKLWKEGLGQRIRHKAQADYSKIIDRRAEAAARAESHCNNKDPSRTEVFRIIRAIEDLAGGAQTA